MLIERKIELLEHIVIQMIDICASNQGSTGQRLPLVNAGARYFSFFFFSIFLLRTFFLYILIIRISIREGELVGLDRSLVASQLTTK